MNIDKREKIYAWESHEEFIAWKALEECRKVNPDCPLAVAENIGAMFTSLQTLLAPIERESHKRDSASGADDYEMFDLAEMIHEVIIRVMRGDECQS